MLGVKLIFKEDGRVHVQAIMQNGRWLSVGQGRQWVDHEGRHILLMVAGKVQELCLEKKSMNWVLRPLNQATIV